METPAPWTRTIRKTYQFIEINGDTLIGDNFELEINEADRSLKFKIDLSNNLSIKKKDTNFYYDAERLIRNKDNVKFILISDKQSIQRIESFLNHIIIDDSFKSSIELTLKENVLSYSVTIKHAKFEKLEFTTS